ncbi:MAG: DUF3592 domain-containing protein [Anaerolineaceae bacterium]|nr:DUF3592 domain-containing protein [Anaerolineaceae bacterium]
MANKRREDRPKQKPRPDSPGDLPAPSLPDEQELMRQSDRFTKMMLAIFGGVGLLLSLIAILIALNIHRKTLNEVQVQGVVTQLMIGEYENGNEFYFPVIEFPLTDGTRQTVQVNEGSSTMDYEPGQSVTIRYLPDQPEEARIESFSSTALRWQGPILIGLVGAGFFAMTAFAWKMTRR